MLLPPPPFGVDDPPMDCPPSSSSQWTPLCGTRRGGGLPRLRPGHPLMDASLGKEERDQLMPSPPLSK